LQYERNYGEAIRLLQARLAQFHYTSQSFKDGDMAMVAYIQRLTGDTAGAKVTAEQARNTYEQQAQSDNPFSGTALAILYAVMGEKDSALKAAERALLLPGAKQPALEERLAIIQTMCGENSRAIATLTKLLQTPYFSSWYEPASITPALLRIDPIWDPLRSDPAFQKLCEEKQP